MTPVFFNWDALTAGTLPTGFTNKLLAGRTPPETGRSRRPGRSALPTSIIDTAATGTGGSGVLYTSMTAIADVCVQFDQLVNLDGSNHGAIALPVIRSSGTPVENNFYTVLLDSFAKTASSTRRSRAR